MVGRNNRKSKKMNVQEKINYYADNMSPRFVKINIVKMCKTFSEIKRYIAREIKGDKNLQFTSDDLRKWAIALNKTFKKMQRDTEFDKLRDELFADGIPTDEVIKNVCEKRKASDNLTLNFQPLVISVNYYATIVSLLEKRWQQLKEESDDLFNDAVLSALMEVY